jgi:hypothetical protein
MRELSPRLTLLLLTLTLACSSAPPSGSDAPGGSSAQAPSGGASAPVARLGDTVITEAELATLAGGRVAAIEAECADHRAGARRP